MKINIDAPFVAITLKLELTRREALALKTVFGKVSGSPNGPRGMTDIIFNELEKIMPQSTLSMGSGQINMPKTWDAFLDA